MRRRGQSLDQLRLDVLGSRILDLAGGRGLVRCGRCRNRIRRCGTACIRRTRPSGRPAAACTPSDPPADTKLASERYIAAWRETRGEAPLPKLGLGRFIVVADTDADALALARRAYP